MNINVLLLGDCPLLEKKKECEGIEVKVSWREQFVEHFSYFLDVEDLKVTFLSGTSPKECASILVEKGEKVVVSTLLASAQLVLLLKRADVVVYVNKGEEVTNIESLFLEKVRQSLCPIIIWTPSEIEDERISKELQLKHLNQVPVQGSFEDVCRALRFIACGFDIHK